MKPKALMDVDGVLNLFLDSETDKHFNRAAHAGFDETYHVNPVGDVKLAYAKIDGATYRLVWSAELPDMIERLRRTFDLVWATSWNSLANEFWLDKMGLETNLPVIELEQVYGKKKPRGFWKIPSVSKWWNDNLDAKTKGVWFDDGIDSWDKQSLPKGLHPVHVTGKTGLTYRLIENAEAMVS